MRRVLVFGTFDRLHQGHLDFLKQAHEYGDELIVVIGRDETVQQVKKHKPHESESIRLQHVQQVSYVTKAVLGNKGDKMKVVEEIAPDVICLGYDQLHFTDMLEEYIRANQRKIEVKRMQPFHPETFKSSLLNN